MEVGIGSLAQLSSHEREIEDRSWEAAAIEKDLLPPLQVIDAAMALLRALFGAGVIGSDAEGDRYCLVVRVYNAIASSVRLARGGYFQESFSVQRGLMEHAFLIDYLSEGTGRFDVWRTASAEDRWKLFRPAIVRCRLKERDGYEPAWRGKMYGLFSEYATHPSPGSRQLMLSGGHLFIGPFFDTALLRHCLADCCRLTVVSTLSVCSLLRMSDAALAEKVQFMSLADAWAQVYMPGYPVRGSGR